MQEKNLYEYAIIRLVPKVEREEFINIGILLFCKTQRSLLIKWSVDEQRIRCMAPYIDLKLVQDQLHSFEKISQGNKDAGLIAQLDVPSRFRWLTAARSSIIQTSRIHPGFADNLQDKLDSLFEELVAIVTE
ncbi:MAG: DUF3037 domain-containing protein [Pseudopedobacter saltans]|uniref:DUF3037 domain-containing protein n=1 Tax=Pseudopedobacter saltans TaxID=151895 RepID=A0A2W5FDG6_9SPHI|nr:MAG: DUF3037 domain-containing protein [Pseudopedobacter saltans]